MNSYWNREKLKSLIIHVIRNTEHEIGLQELMNRIHLMDIAATGKLGKSITRSSYIKVRDGVKIKGIEGIINEMVSENSIQFSNEIMSENSFSGE